MYGRIVVEQDDGEYVLYADHEAELKGLQEELAGVLRDLSMCSDRNGELEDGIAECGDTIAALRRENARLHLEASPNSGDFEEGAMRVAEDELRDQAK